MQNEHNEAHIPENMVLQ